MRKFSFYSIVVLITFVLFLKYQSKREIYSDYIVISATYFKTSKIFEDNTVVILFNGQKSLNQENDVVCVSENETHRLQAVTKPQFAYNPTRECKFGSFIIICNVVPTLKTFYLTKNIGNKQLAKIRVRTPHLARSPVVVCFSPLFYFENWRLLLTSLEIYKYYGANLQVVYVQSMLSSLFALLQVYEKNKDVAIESWQSHDLTKDLISKIGYDPNLELDWRNQAASHTDCLLKYKEAADFIIINDLDDVLVPKLASTLLAEFNLLSNKFPSAAGFSYYRFNVAIKDDFTVDSFSFSKLLKSAKISKQKENQKYVLKTNKALTAWLHWPGIVLPGYEMFIVPEKNFMLHLRNWTKDISTNNKDMNPTQLEKFISSNDQVMIENDFQNRIASTLEFKNLPTLEIYSKLIVKCYDEIFYSKKRQPNKCPGPNLCSFKSQPGIHCTAAKKALTTRYVTKKLRITTAAEDASFITYKNGCSMK